MAVSLAPFSPSLAVIPSGGRGALVLWTGKGAVETFFCLSGTGAGAELAGGGGVNAARFADVPPKLNGGGGNGAGGGGSEGKMTRVKIGDLMQQSGVKFGTSGARGLVSEMTDRVCFAYTAGFLQYLMRRWDLKEGGEVAIAGDLRQSTDRIMAAAAAAAVHLGCRPVNLGKVPSPASAHFGIQRGVPSVMVTGSHIPDDRNGIKFNKADGEILKADEASIREEVVEIPERLFTADGSFAEGAVKPIPAAVADAEEMFFRRYADFFGAEALKGSSIALYQHSAVGRDLLARVLAGLGAEVTAVGRSERFLPVDTEAIRPEDVELASRVAAEGRFDAIVSTDGDSDRPLVAGRDGKWLRGDVLGILVAKFLGADAVSAPVSCNTALEKSEYFASVRRTRIGSPFVIASMVEAVAAGASRAVSYEANGGFLTATDIEMGGRVLSALPTRDAFLPIIAAVMLAKREGRGVEELTAELPQRFTASSVIKNFPVENSSLILKELASGDSWADLPKIEKGFGEAFGPVKGVDYTDGLRITFESGDVVHLRPSGNAPEFRIYTESVTEPAAEKTNRAARGIVEEMMSQGRS